MTWRCTPQHHELLRTLRGPVEAPELDDLTDGEQPPEWIHLVPFGRWEGHFMGAFEVGADEAAQAVANFNRGGIELALDYEHQSLNTLLNGQPAPAAGWVDRLEIRDDGVWGHVRMWTARAAEFLANREYRYLSPVLQFGATDRETGEPVGLALLPAGLTNMPFLQSDIEPLVNRTSTEPSMDLTALVTLLALSATATIEDVEAAVKDLVDLRDQARGALGLEGDPSTQDIAAGLACAARQAELGRAAIDELGWDAVPDDGITKLRRELKHVGYVPMSEHAAALARGDQAVADQSNEQIVADAKAAGKLTPAQEEWFRRELGRGGDHREAALSWLSSAPIVVPNTGGARPSVVTSPAPQLTEQQLQVCRQLKLDPAEYAKQLAARQ